MEQIMKLENMEKKEALSRVKAWNLDADDMEVLSALIPELKESEDEGIRKGLIEHLKELKEQSVEGSHLKRPEHYDAWISWLEKQGSHIKFLQSIQIGDEVTRNPDGVLVNLSQFKRKAEQGEQNLANSYCQKNCKGFQETGRCFTDGECKAKIEAEQNFAEKVESKFKVGDWVVYNCDICQIVKREEGCNKLVTNFGIEKELVNERNLSTARLWTIEDAKAGDVLHTTSTASNETFIFKGLTAEGNIVCYCSYDSEDKYCEGTHHFIGKPTFMTHPATKEQRDKLEKAITKAGYKWDAEKMELKKIEQNPADNVEKNAFEWSEQDENNKDLLIDIIRRDLKLSADEFTRLAGWLTNLQDRLNSRPKSLIHDGTKQMFNSISNYLHYKGYEDESNSMRAFVNKDVIGITEFINEISEYLKTNMNGSDPEFIGKFKTFVKTLFYEKESKS